MGQIFGFDILQNEMGVQKAAKSTFSNWIDVNETYLQTS